MTVMKKQYLEPRMDIDDFGDIISCGNGFGVGSGDDIGPHAIIYEDEEE